MNTMLYRKVEDTIRRHEMLKRGDRVLVAVSGGPDSVFLLEALYNLKDKLDIKIFVANLDHGIRGKRSMADSRFVINMAKTLGLKYIHKKLRLTKKDLSSKLSTEEILRIERYNFFKEAAKKIGANILATGHTLDDQAETVLMRVIKGSTIKGLVGIFPVRKNNGLNIIRPIMDIEKKEILDFLSRQKIPYRLDQTNFQERFFRNRLRKKVLPYLERYNPRIKRSLCLMAESLREDREFIEEARKKKKSLRKNGKYVEIMLKDIVVQPKSLQREILRDALIESNANIKKLTYRHWKDMDEFLKYKRKGKALDLPDGMVVERKEKTLLFRKRN